MQISDMLGQYNKNVMNGTEELHGAQSVQKLVSSVGDLEAGSIFEGTINHVRGGKVTLALGNGQTITARLDGKVDLQPGSSMFFQVKANDGLTVSIRPYTEFGNASNPTLFNALSAAQVPVTDRTLRMVDAMMQEQLPIGRQSVLDMAKLVNANPNANVQTIVQMAKLGLPVTEMMASQFEGYLSNQHELLNELELATGQMLEVLGDEAMSPEESFSLYGKLLAIFSAKEGQGMTALPAEGEAVQGQNAEGTVLPAGGEAAQGQTAGAVESGLTAEDALWMDLQPEEKAAVQQQGAAASEQLSMGTEQLVAEGGAAAKGETLGGLLTEEQLLNLTKALQNIPTLLGNEELFAGAAPEEIFVDTLSEEPPDMEKLMAAENGAEFAETAVNKDMTAEQFLSTLHRALAENGQYGFSGLKQLFAGKEFQQLFLHVVEKQWLMEPRELAGEKKIGELYERMERQIQQMESAVKTVGITQDSFLHTASDIRGNIEFMNYMNHIYNYVQIPLKMSGQNANGELYVYTNKKNFTDADAELTAFLHLDMGNLGSTDVSVRMQNRQVRTNFYFEDDASYALVEKHLPILEKRLKNKGYSCTITITNEKKNINFKENFLRKGSAPVGSLHRYSFDVRA